jgi:hypothetical protein
MLKSSVRQREKARSKLLRECAVIRFAIVTASAAGRHTGKHSSQQAPPIEISSREPWY